MKNTISINKDTIFALSTAGIKSGVAVIRISGKDALSVTKLCDKRIIKSRFVYYTKFYDQENKLIDNILAIYFKSPNSFTGEDIVELHLHGSKAVIKLALETLGKIPNYRLALPGEFSQRSFINGKMDLTQAEALADIIDAETEAQLQQALRQYSGYAKQIIDNWRLKLIDIMSLIEAYIDFPDEDLPADIVSEVEENITNLSNEILTHLNDRNSGEKIRDGFNIAIIGEPNTGKSSLLNLLAKREIAIVSEIPGTTRDSLEVHLDISGYPVILHDTAGIRESSDIIENKGILIAKDKANSADLKLILLDANNPEINDEISQLIDPNSLIVINKIDTVQNLKDPFLSNKIYISVKTSQNIELLIDEIKKFTIKFFENAESSLISRHRHREALNQCVNALTSFSLKKDIELAAEDLRLAANYLGRITGEIDVELILDKIFSSFCIGK